MDELQQIEATVKTAALRKRWQMAWAGIWLAFLGGVALFLLTLSAYKLAPLPEWVLLAAAAVAAAALPVGFLCGWMRRQDLPGVARWLDQREQLQERLSTAMELAHRPSAGEWSHLVLRDAAAHARGFDLRRLLPWRLPPAAKWSLVGLVLAGGLGFVPEHRSPAYAQKQRERENIRQVAQGLELLTKHNLEQNPPALEPTSRALEAVMDVTGALVKNPPARGEALRELGKVAEQIQKQAAELQDKPAIRKLDQAAREQAAAGPANPGDWQKQIEALQEKLGEAAGKPEAIEKLRDDLLKAQAKAGNLPAKGTPEGDAARQEMARTLAELAQRSRNLGQNLEGLEEALAALEAGDTDLFLKDLDLAVKDLDQLREMAKALQQMRQQAAKKMGKDLAEQLKYGQAEAAIQTLRKMEAMLQSGQLSAPQMGEILKEVQNALDPAKDYGDVAQKLAKAGQCLKKGLAGEAGQALGEAAREIEQLLEQMGDAQSLAAALEALQRAQLAISTCQGLGACRGLPQAGQGGKPGEGVGTWAEETGWLYYPDKRDQLWDNTGIERPDLDPRGHSDREASRPDNLTPSKVRGQFAPGNSMPSITLKGVSIRGASSVQYEEAAAAAQTEAQNALSQDQVPRAYRGAVKDYFDDLKK